MKISQTIADAAHQIAQQADARAVQLQEDLADAQAKVRDIQAKLDPSNLTLQRLANFKIKIGADYQCPRCYILDGRVSALKPVPSDSREDIFRCHECGLELSSAGY